MVDTPTLPNLTVQQLEYMVAVAVAPTRAAAAARVGVTASALTPVSYTHLTLPTICSV